MNRSRVPILLFLVILLVASVLFGYSVFTRPDQSQQAQAQIIGLDVAPSISEFERVTGPRSLKFPLDHGPHPDFQTEWWYYTGNLQTSDDRHFGYQLTFFRRALQPASLRQPRNSRLAVEQIYMAHLAISDVAGNQFYAFERFERGAADLAGASAVPLYQVWLHDWSVKQVSENEYRLHAEEEDVTLDLTLVDEKGIVLQGDKGYSRKGPEVGNASIYYSQPRLESTGEIILNGISYSVSGLSWLDREISTSALSEGQVGWDWFALQLDDGSELMVYLLRRADGSVDSFSKGIYIQPGKVAVNLEASDFQVVSGRTWRSPHTGADYPAQWKINIPSVDLSLQIEPFFADQELNLSFIYWEGAVRVDGTRAGKNLAGSGYVELTGYARSLEGGL